MAEITSTADMALDEFDGGEPEDVRSDIVATDAAEERGIEFHVSMRDYTQRDMEGLIIEAAARMIVGRRNDQEVAKLIEARCIELVTAKADRALAEVTAAIIDQPLIPSFGKEPVTMRDFLGLTGREYLAELVDYEGKPSKDSYSRHTQSRMQWLVSRHMQKAFKDEIEKATNAAVRDVQAAITAQHKALLEAEKARFAAALAKAAS